MKGPHGYPASVFCTEGCGRHRQQGKDGMCCRCWRVATGLPPRGPGGPRSAVKPDPLAVAWAELQASDVLPAPVVDVVNTAPKVGQTRCRECRLRWPQQYGLCRTCAEALAAAAGCPSVRQYLEAEHLAREEARVGKLRVVLVPREERELVVDGVAFMVRGLSVRPLAEGELERELAAARNPTGWAANGSPWSRTQKR